MKISGAAIFLFLTIIFSFTTADKLTGRWESKPSEKGNITGVVFKDDNSFEGYVNKKPFVTGVYSFSDGILSFTDNGCEGKKGVYQIYFFHNGDSLRFQPLDDICAERKNGMSHLVLGKVR